jgi:hypothetical protein
MDGFGLVSLFGLAIMVVQAGFYFGLAYLAARLAIRHERRAQPGSQS